MYVIAISVTALLCPARHVGNVTYGLLACVGHRYQRDGPPCIVRSISRRRHVANVTYIMTCSTLNAQHERVQHSS